MELPNEALVNYVMPNNTTMAWSILVVIYPFITGLIAGAFVVSSLSHVFKVREFKPIANFALIMAFCFGLFAFMPLLLHLGQPQRAFNIYFTPHLTSAMSMFGYIYGSYLILLMVEIWLIYRPHFIRRYQETTGIQRLIWQVLTLGVTVYHPDSEKTDQKIVAIIAGLGIPWSFALHGYVGFVFGSVKAVAWWASPLQPLIFLLSAIVSGMAMLMMAYSFIKWRTGQPCDYAMIRKLMAYLWAVFLFDVALEVLEVSFPYYEHGYQWSVVGPLLGGPLWTPFVIIQMLILSGISVVLLGYIILFNVTGKMLLYLSNLASFMIVLEVLFMRYSMVIGGQMISKSERGFVAYDWEIFGREGLLVCALLLAAPFFVYYFLGRVLPIFSEEDGIK